MRLYKMELYKICHRKIFLLGTACLIGILFLFFQLKVSEERTYVNGVLYKGYEAVQMNREITEEFKGELTDEKAGEIIGKYGFPHEVERNYWSFADANFLNDLMTNYLSDGYYVRWDNYEVPTTLLAIEDTILGEVKEITGKEVVLEYCNGWCLFLKVLEIGLILGSILILFGISVVFALEGQSKMIQVLFTTKEGRKKDIYAKIAAAFTVSGAVWVGVVILDLLFCGLVYGFDGWKCLVGMTEITGYLLPMRPATMMSVGVYVLIVLFRSMLGILLLCATTIYISACFANSFHAVIYSSLFWGAPVLIWILLDNNFHFISRLIRTFTFLTPIYQVMVNSFLDCYWIWTKLAGISIVISILCTVLSYRKYKRQQVGA